ncbi:hypothetical protein HDU79_004475 [Rhizoclosmatium sp. JEL0117]|nr:hypothetical protein HDU79_004475 [Rhizoclosmatium sp. JEL0117]
MSQSTPDKSVEQAYASFAEQQSNPTLADQDSDDDHHRYRKPPMSPLHSVRKDPMKAHTDQVLKSVVTHIREDGHPNPRDAKHTLMQVMGAGATQINKDQSGVVGSVEDMNA